MGLKYNLCSDCENEGHLKGSCKKGHEITFVDGCEKCGHAVNRKEVEEGIPCPDYDEKDWKDSYG